MRKINEFTYDYDPQRSVVHDLCDSCSKNNITCMPSNPVCAAIEILVQLCKVKDGDKQLEYIYNIGTKLDLENSFNGIADEQ